MLKELEAAGEKADRIKGALSRLKDTEHKLATVNRYVADKAGKKWSVDLCLERSGGYGRDTNITVHIPFEYIVRQAIVEVIDARRNVVLAGGELPPATEQVQRGRA